MVRDLFLSLPWEFNKTLMEHLHNGKIKDLDSNLKRGAFEHFKENSHSPSPLFSKILIRFYKE